MRWIYPLLADAILCLHLLFVAFMVCGLLLTVVGGYFGWAWIRNSWFRIGHLAGIGVVVAQAWVGLICPLTTLEMWLRRQADQSAYSTSFIQHWFQRILYFDAPLWIFAIAYTLFGAFVVLAWMRFPPNFIPNRTRGAGRHKADSLKQRSKKQNGST